MSQVLATVLILVSADVAFSFQPASVPTITNQMWQLSRLQMSSGELSDSASRNIIGIARSFATTNLGVTDPSLLSDSFVCSGPTFNNIEKKSYLAGLTKETATFQRAIPDFDLRPYSFSVDENQPDTVWFKIRPTGRITGPFAYKGEVYLPNQKVVELPAQQLSVTIQSGQITRVTAGYTIDRFTGNTGGLAGPMGILYALGEAPSKFSYIPPAVVVRQFLSRTKKPVIRKVVKVSPFPLAVMTSLAKRVVETSLGAEEDSLLSSDFQFSGPLVGPLSKDEFVGALKSFNLKSPFPDLKSDSYCYEVDSYDPERVWVISKGSGTQTGPLILGGKVMLEPTGNVYDGPPEAVSVSFNEQGLCYKATAGYILDKDQGNTKGLGGVYGIFEAIGNPLPWWESRTIGELPGLIKESLFPSEPPVQKTAPAPVKKAAPAPPVVAKQPVAPPVIVQNVEVPVSPKVSASQASIPTITTVKIPQPPAPKKPEPIKAEVKKVEAKKVAEPKVAVSVPITPKEVKAPPAENGFFSFMKSTPAPQVSKSTATVAMAIEGSTVAAPPVKKGTPPAKKATPPAAPAVVLKSAPPAPTPVKKFGMKAESKGPITPVIVADVAPVPVEKPKAAGMFSFSKGPITPVIIASAAPVPAEKPKAAGMFSMKSSKGPVTPVIVAESPPVPAEKPKASGGMFSMKISKGSTGKLTTGASSTVKDSAKSSSAKSSK